MTSRGGTFQAALESSASTVVALNDQLAAVDLSRRRDIGRLAVALAVACTLLIAAGTPAAIGWAGIASS